MMYEIRIKVQECFTRFIGITSEKSRSGFSLIELLVAFTLITILSGIGFASFVTYSRSQIVNQATANLKQDIDVARFDAISYVKPDVCDSQDLSSFKVRFCHNGGCFSSDSSYELSVNCGGEELMKSGQFPENVAFENVDGQPDCTVLTYSVGSGIVSGTPCQVNVVGYGNTITLNIDTGGNASF